MTAVIKYPDTVACFHGTPVLVGAAAAVAAVRRRLPEPS